MSRWKTEVRRLRMWGGRAAIVLATVLLAGLNGAVAVAQQDQGGFMPAKDIARETLPALPLVYAAYGFVWVALVAYVFLLWRRLGRVEQELRDVSAKITGGKR